MVDVKSQAGCHERLSCSISFAVKLKLASSSEMASEHGASVDGHVLAKSHTIKKKLRKKFQRKLECASCKEICKSPKQWECSHYFCSPCLDELTTTRRLPRRCPECENEIRASHDGRRAQELPPDAFLELLIEVFDEFRSQYQLDSEDESLECRGCKKRGAPVAYCCDCDNHFLCEGCRTQHENLTVFEGHCVEAMEDLELESIAKQRARFCNVAGHEAKNAANVLNAFATTVRMRGMRGMRAMPTGSSL